MFDTEGTCKGKAEGVPCTKFLYPMSNSEYLPEMEWVGRTNTPELKGDGQISMWRKEWDVKQTQTRWGDEDGIPFQIDLIIIIVAHTGLTKDLRKQVYKFTENDQQKNQIGFGEIFGYSF